MLGLFRFDLFGHTAYVYSLVVLFVLFLLARRIVHSPFGLSLQAIRGNPLRASAVGIAVNWRLVAIYTLAAGYAGIAGALLAQTQAFASLDVFSIDRSADVLLVLIIGGTGYLYGGLIGALIYRLMQDYLVQAHAAYWQFWIGLVLVMIVLFGRERHPRGRDHRRDGLAQAEFGHELPGHRRVPVRARHPARADREMDRTTQQQAVAAFRQMRADESRR